MAAQKPSKSEYHHYVPRFLLRKWAPDLPVQVVKGLASAKPLTNRTTKRNKQVNIYHRKENDLKMAHSDSKSISRNYGVFNLYVDHSNQSDIYHIEGKFSALESIASPVIQRLTDAAKTYPACPVSVSRKEFNTLYKFLFLLAYRNSDVAQQIHADHQFAAQTEACLQEHKDRIMAPGATNRDVWLQNIREILDTNVWEIPEKAEILLPDRRFFAQEMRGCRLVLWQSPQNEEFVICNNGFGFMDATEYLLDPVAKEKLLRSRYHRSHPGLLNINEPLPPDLRRDVDRDHMLHIWVRVFPVGPSLVLALVDMSLYPENAANLETLLRMGSPSRFQTFPFAKEEIDYKKDLSDAGHGALARGDMETLLGGPVAVEAAKQSARRGLPAPLFIDGRVAESREKDILTFPIVQLSVQQVNLVNGLVLEYADDQLTFRCPQNLYRYVQAYEDEQLWDNHRDYGALKTLLTYNEHPAQGEDDRAPSMSASDANVALPGLNIYHMSKKKLALRAKGEICDCHMHRSDGNAVYARLEQERQVQLGIKLTNLEAEAARVVTAVIEAAEKDVSAPAVLSRLDLNALAKYLFLWGYRCYSPFTEDRRVLWTNVFDTRKRYNLYAKFTPSDLGGWIDNFHAIVSTQVWDIPYNKRIFPEDRTQFMRDLRRYNLVFWRAADDEEFVISDTRLGYCDGVDNTVGSGLAARLDIPFFVPSLSTSPAAGDTDACIQFPIRVFPISPRLAVVLVDKLFSDKQSRLTLTDGLFPESRLSGFPFLKPLVKYAADLTERGQAKMDQDAQIPIDDRLVNVEEKLRELFGGHVPPPLIDGKIVESRESDSIDFEVAQLSKEETRTINGLTIKKAEDCLVFQSPERLLRYVQEVDKGTTQVDESDYGHLEQALEQCIRLQESTEPTDV